MRLKRTVNCLAAVLAIVFGTALWSGIAPAQDSIRIAAVVNDDAISMLDVWERMQIVFVTANLQDDEETRRRLFPQVLRALIDERLQLQEGERQEIELSDAELETATVIIENAIGLPEGKLEEFLEYNNVSQDSFMQQVRAELTWNKLVQRRMRPDSVSEDEVDERLARMKADANQPAYLLAEIFLAVDDPSRESEVLANMERLADSIRGGADFAALARQFSQSASSAAGGDLGWILASQLPEDMRAAVVQMTPVSMSPPVEVPGGYKLILLRDQRVGFENETVEEELVLRQIVLPADVGADETALSAEAEAIADSLAICDDFNAIGEGHPEAQVSPAVTVRPSEMQPAMLDVVKNLPINQPSEPVRSEMGFHVLMVCERTEVAKGLPTRQQILQQLEDEQFDLVSRGYLRDLRRTAFIDIRL
jgi:peptidyl-prolyl cis-trans isomerase SurA